jgi:hypothetical protein
LDCFTGLGRQGNANRDLQGIDPSFALMPGRPPRTTSLAMPRLPFPLAGGALLLPQRRGARRQGRQEVLLCKQEITSSQLARHHIAQGQDVAAVVGRDDGVGTVLRDEGQKPDKKRYAEALDADDVGIERRKAGDAVLTGANLEQNLAPTRCTTSADFDCIITRSTIQDVVISGGANPVIA